MLSAGLQRVLVVDMTDKRRRRKTEEEVEDALLSCIEDGPIKVEGTRRNILTAGRHNEHASGVDFKNSGCSQCPSVAAALFPITASMS